LGCALGASSLLLGSAIVSLLGGVKVKSVQQHILWK
jgi:hypothetical protein